MRLQVVAHPRTSTVLLSFPTIRHMRQCLCPLGTARRTRVERCVSCACPIRFTWLRFVGNARPGTGGPNARCFGHDSHECTNVTEGKPERPHADPWATGGMNLQSLLVAFAGPPAPDACTHPHAATQSLPCASTHPVGIGLLGCPATYGSRAVPRPLPQNYTPQLGGMLKQ